MGDVRLEIVLEQLPADETSGRLRLPALETNRGTLNPEQEATPSLATAKETSVDASVAVAFTRHGKGFSYERISKNSTALFLHPLLPHWIRKLTVAIVFLKSSMETQQMVSI